MYACHISLIVRFLVQFALQTVRTKENNLCVLLDDIVKMVFNDSKRSSVRHGEGNEEEKNCADIVTGDNVTKKN